MIAYIMIGLSRSISCFCDRKNLVIVLFPFHSHYLISHCFLKVW